jgi:hypothetical protein
MFHLYFQNSDSAGSSRLARADVSKNLAVMLPAEAEPVRLVSRLWVDGRTEHEGFYFIEHLMGSACGCRLLAAAPVTAHSQMSVMSRDQTL